MIAFDLRDKVALVTGASQGLGAETAQWLHRAGATVVINYFPDAAGQHAGAAANLVGRLQERALALPADVRDSEAVRQMFAAATEKFGAVHIVVNNAGILRDRTLRKMSNDEWQQVIDTNLTGVFHVCRAALEVMPAGGRIVNLASVSAVLGTFGQANYVAAKAGVMGLTRVLSHEVAKRGITVNAVAPGVVLTEMGRSIPEPVRETMLASVPLGRFGEPADIASAILFLCSDFASYITGQTIHVNGGVWG